MATQPVPVMACPICRTGLVLSERQEIEIDYCPTCRGVWLDRGELDKIIERSARDVAQRQAGAPPWPAGPERHFGHGGYEHGYGYRKRKKSFLSELFD